MNRERFTELVRSLLDPERAPEAAETIARVAPDWLREFYQNKALAEHASALHGLPPRWEVRTWGEYLIVEGLEYDPFAGMWVPAEETTFVLTYPETLNAE